MQGEMRNIHRIKKKQSLPGGGENDCCFVLTGEEQQ